jgi:hypothetical protein
MSTICVPLARQSISELRRSRGQGQQPLQGLKPANAGRPGGGYRAIFPQASRFRIRRGRCCGRA